MYIAIPVCWLLVYVHACNVITCQTGALQVADYQIPPQVFRLHTSKLDMCDKCINVHELYIIICIHLKFEPMYVRMLVVYNFIR